MRISCCMTVVVFRTDFTSGSSAVRAMGLVSCQVLFTIQHLLSTPNREPTLKTYLISQNYNHLLLAFSTFSPVTVTRP